MSHGNASERIFLNEIHRQDIRHDRIAVRTEKAMSEVINCVAKLTGTSDGFKLHRLRVKAKVDARNIHRLSGFKTRSSTPDLAVSVGQIDPVVETVAWASNLHLRMSGSKSIEPNFSDISYVIAIGVGQIHDLSFSAGQHPVTKCQQAVAKLQMRCVDRSLVHLTVGIFIFQQDNL